MRSKCKKVNKLNTDQRKQLCQRRSAVASNSVLKSRFHLSNSIKEHVSKPKKSPDVIPKKKKKCIMKYKSSKDQRMVENITPKPIKYKYDYLGMVLRKKKCLKKPVSNKSKRQKQQKVFDYTELYGKSFDKSKSMKLDRLSMKVETKLPKML